MRHEFGLSLLILSSLVPANLAIQAQQPKQDAPDTKKQDNKKKDQTFMVKGKVVNRDGGDVPNALVKITGPKGSMTQTTDSTGAFSFEGPAGKYTIDASAGGKSAKPLLEDISSDKQLKSLTLE
jgi:hypothetical protein